jgi:hypothetical protein
MMDRIVKRNYTRKMGINSGLRHTPYKTRTARKYGTNSFRKKNERRGGAITDEMLRESVNILAKGWYHAQLVNVVRKLRKLMTSSTSSARSSVNELPNIAAAVVDTILRQQSQQRISGGETLADIMTSRSIANPQTVIKDMADEELRDCLFDLLEIVDSLVGLNRTSADASQVADLVTQILNALTDAIQSYTTHGKSYDHPEVQNAFELLNDRILELASSISSSRSLSKTHNQLYDWPILMDLFAKTKNTEFPREPIEVENEHIPYRVINKYIANRIREIERRYDSPNLNYTLWYLYETIYDTIQPQHLTAFMDPYIKTVKKTVRENIDHFAEPPLQTDVQEPLISFNQNDTIDTSGPDAV